MVLFEKSLENSHTFLNVKTLEFLVDKSKFAIDKNTGGYCVCIAGVTGGGKTVLEALERASKNLKKKNEERLDKAQKELKRRERDVDQLVKMEKLLQDI